jgi:hypothetical protein
MKTGRQEHAASPISVVRLRLPEADQGARVGRHVPPGATGPLGDTGSIRPIPSVGYVDRRRNAASNESVLWRRHHGRSDYSEPPPGG